MMGDMKVEVPRRIRRGDDENLYQPKIHSTRIRQLYQISQQFHLPLTVLVDQAIGEYINQIAETNNERDFNHQRE